MTGRGVKFIYIVEGGYLLRTECPICGHSHSIKVSAEGLSRYFDGGLIQDCFPELSADEREMIISGICPECWEKMFGGVE